MRDIQSPEQTKPIATKAPLLCLDIDGVISPTGGTYRYHEIGFIPGFVEISIRQAEQMHPSMKEWIETLTRAFRQNCIWLSARNSSSADFAQKAGLVDTLDWEYLCPVRKKKMPKIPKTNKGIQNKVKAIIQGVKPKVPVAAVDDHLSRRKTHLFSDIDKSLDMLFARKGPTLVVAPDPSIGLTQDMVDTLCRFAKDPYAPEFQKKEVIEGRNYDLAWPWPVGYAVNPVTLDEKTITKRDFLSTVKGMMNEGSRRPNNMNETMEKIEALMDKYPLIENSAIRFRIGYNKAQARGKDPLDKKWQAVIEKIILGHRYNQKHLPEEIKKRMYWVLSNEPHSIKLTPEWHEKLNRKIERLDRINNRKIKLKADESPDSDTSGTFAPA